MNTQELIEHIKDKDDKVRTKAWQSAGEVGAPAVKPLAATMTDADLEIARAAKRGLWQMVRHVGRPGADDERKPVVAELAGLLGGDQPVAVRREALWMLSEIAADDLVSAIAALLADEELREDARMVLQRTPGKASLSALQDALAAAPADFKPNIAESLRNRGVKVRKYPSQKLKPVKSTHVKPVGR